ncbi:MAG: hypothetical protein L0206_20400, partial [Actinobacteria bacterium]|nr:hypothetical protein [Actinomycetota bacterium]
MRERVKAGEARNRTARRGSTLSIRHLVSSLGVAAVLTAAPFSDANATCNVIPGATQEFRGAMGVANRPFASPGDFVRLRVRPAVCDTGSTGFVDLEGGSQRTDDYVVTVLFTPPNGPANAVLLAEDCTGFAAACEASLGAGTATCVDGASGLVVPDDENLSFRFPDTDDRVGTASDDQTLTGPAKLIVTAVSAPLRCDLATTRCANATGVVACVDELFEIDGTCRTETARVDSVFPNFTALPPPNSYQAMCATAGTPCTGTATEVHFTVDQAGNVLVPIDWSGVRVFLDGVPVPRLVRGNTSKPAFASAPGIPVKVPGKGFITSYSPEGIRLPPIFTPIPDPAETNLVLFGTIDAPRGVSRIARHSPVFEECSTGGQPCTEDADCPGTETCVQATCQGGVNDGDPCDEDADCAGTECGAPLFKFSDRLESDVGPVVVASAEYDAQAETPVPLDGLLETPAVFAFAVSEGLAGENRNGGGPDGDLDQRDLVMTLGDRAQGLGEPLSAVVRVRRPPFSFAAAAAENDV